MYANLRAAFSCWGCRSGLNVEWWSQPTVLLLSVKANILGYLVLWSSAPIESSIVMIDAINSRRFMDPLRRRCSGRRYRQA